jgi:uncharacterized protein (DUF3820 family)
MTDNDLMPFGKYKGEKMANVPPEYLLWFFEPGNGYATVRGYVRDNLDVIKAEIELKNKTGKR